MNLLPGPGQTAPVSNRPAGSVAGGGWIEDKPVRVVLAKVNTSGSANTSAAVAADIYVPGARVIAGISLSFEPKQPQAFTNYNSAVWSLSAARPGRGEGRRAALHSIFSSQALPQLYEVSSAVRLYVMTATLTVPLTAGAAAIEGEWVLEVDYEPAMPMCEPEVTGMYALCSVVQTIKPSGPLAP